MNRSPNMTAPADAIPATRFRAQCTGIGQQVGASEATGLARAERVVECMPKAVRQAVPAAEGYPGVGQARK